jgi:hypothetical protein
MVTAARPRDRVFIQLPGFLGSRGERELRAFTHYCVRRIEQDLGEHQAWTVAITPALGGFAAHISVRDRGVAIEGRGSGQDGTLATWEAMCRIEERLRECRW